MPGVQQPCRMVEIDLELVATRACGCKDTPRLGSSSRKRDPPACSSSFMRGLEVLQSWKPGTSGCQAPPGLPPEFTWCSRPRKVHSPCFSYISAIVYISYVSHALTGARPEGRGVAVGASATASSQACHRVPTPLRHPHISRRIWPCERFSSYDFSSRSAGSKARQQPLFGAGAHGPGAPSAVLPTAAMGVPCPLIHTHHSHVCVRPRTCGVLNAGAAQWRGTV